MCDISYLSWIKDLDVQFAQWSGILKPFYDLTSSAVRHSEDFVTLLKESRFTTQQSPHGECVAWGHPRLRQLLAARYKVAEERIVLTSGASLALVLACRALLKQGDPVLLERPTYEPFKAAVQVVGGEISYFDRKVSSPGIDLDHFEWALKEYSPKLIIISNPHNPTGTVLADSVLVEMNALGQAHGARLLVDEVFRDLAMPFSTAAESIPEAMCINSLSKAYGLSMLRCGWIICPSELVADCSMAQVAIENIGSGLTQGLAVRVLEKLTDFQADAAKRVEAYREIMNHELSPVIGTHLDGKIPQQGCIYFPRLVTGSVARLDVLLREQDTFIVPGHYFGEPSHFRIGFGDLTDSNDLRIALGRLRTTISGFSSDQ